MTAAHVHSHHNMKENVKPTMAQGLLQSQDGVGIATRMTKQGSGDMQARSHSKVIQVSGLQSDCRTGTWNHAI